MSLAVLPCDGRCLQLAAKDVVGQAEAVAGLEGGRVTQYRQTALKVRRGLLWGAVCGCFNPASRPPAAICPLQPALLFPAWMPVLTLSLLLLLPPLLLLTAIAACPSVVRPTGSDCCPARRQGLLPGAVRCRHGPGDAA